MVPKTFELKPTPLFHQGKEGEAGLKSMVDAAMATAEKKVPTPLADTTSNLGDSQPCTRESVTGIGYWRKPDSRRPLSPVVSPTLQHLGT
jgi:hypothetical protein